MGVLRRWRGDLEHIQFSKYHPASFYFGTQQLDIVINRIIWGDVTRQFMPDHGDCVEGRAKLCAAAVAKVPRARVCCSSTSAKLASASAPDKCRALDATHQT